VLGSMGSLSLVGRTPTRKLDPTHFRTFENGCGSGKLHTKSMLRLVRRKVALLQKPKPKSKVAVLQAPQRKVAVLHHEMHSVEQTYT